MANRLFSKHLVPIRLDPPSCKCLSLPQDPRLAEVLSDADLEEMRRFHAASVPKTPWWSSLTLWGLVLIVPIAVGIWLTIQDTTRSIGLTFVVFVVVLAVATLLDVVIAWYRAWKHRPAIRAELE